MSEQFENHYSFSYLVGYIYTKGCGLIPYTIIVLMNDLLNRGGETGPTVPCEKPHGRVVAGPEGKKGWKLDGGK